MVGSCHWLTKIRQPQSGFMQIMNHKALLSTLDSDLSNTLTATLDCCFQELCEANNLEGVESKYECDIMYQQWDQFVLRRFCPWSGPLVGCVFIMVGNFCIKTFCSISGAVGP